MIIFINGPAKSGKSSIATALRNNQISNKHGALLIDEQCDGELDPLIEKIIVGVNVPQTAPADLSSIPWKPNSMVILVGPMESMLDKIEARLPGFTEFHGPVYRVDTGTGKPSK